jgi:Fic family protein
MDVKMNRENKGDFLFQSIKEGYRSVTPSLINRSFEWKDKQINILLESAMLELGELNAYSKFFPDVENYIPLFVAHEVIASNLIEGSKCELTQAFVAGSSRSYKSSFAQKEITNHIDAINWGLDELAKFPLSIRLIKESHRILCSDLPKKEDHGGKIRSYFHAYDRQFREEFDYIPPNKHELKILINDAKKFWRNDDLELPQLIKMAISLYQFENILPFLDGNGRTARTLILFEMISLKFVATPVFCLSVFFEQNRLEYYNRLNLIRTKNDIEQWIRFFLTGIKESAIHSKQILSRIEKLNDSYLETIDSKLGVKRHAGARELLKLFYNKPFLSVKDVWEKKNVAFQTANLWISDFEELGFLSEYVGTKRNRVFYLAEYVSLFHI